MKYAKLFALVLLAWAAVYIGTLTLSLRAADPDTRSAAVALLVHDTLPSALQPKTYGYTERGKTYTTTGPLMDAYQARQSQKSFVALAMDEHSGAYLLALWCTKVLPWLALIASLWLLNFAAGIRRLADALA